MIQAIEIYCQKIKREMEELLKEIEFLKKREKLNKYQVKSLNF